ncbi:MAG: transglutaminase-like domain-containing protein [Myxococcota bacterium]|nr:transglutaminase-like domain-containing protein [Myxococcota bacterium]
MTPPQPVESMFVCLLKASTLTVAVILCLWPLTGGVPVAAAAGATLVSAFVARRIERLGLRLVPGLIFGAVLMLFGAYLGAAARGTGMMFSFVDAKNSLTLADGLSFGFGAFGLAFGLRLLTARRRAFASLEAALVVAAVAQVFARHRNYALDRPLFLSDWALTKGIDPQLVLQAVGIGAALIAILMALRNQTTTKLVLTLTALMVLGYMVYHFTENMQIRQELAGFLIEKGEENQAKRDQQTDGQSGTTSDQSRDGSGGGRGPSNQPPPLPVAVALFHSDFEPENNILYFRQQALSKFDGKRLVADSSRRFDGDVIAEFPHTASVEADIKHRNDDHRRVSTSMFLMADHPQPVALSSSVSVTPRKNPSPRRFRSAYDATSMVPTIPLYRLVGRPSVPDEWSQAQREHFLQHPDDPRYLALSEEIVREIDLRFSGDDIVKALAIKDYLETNGYYTRRERHAGAEDSAASFLFGNLRGYCVHFAHAAVHLLRSQGIAARVAVGYAVDNRMRGSGSAVVIMGDRAHAWPEIHVAGLGWITFDIYPQQSDEPPPQVVAQSLESLLGEIARDDPTGGRSENPDQAGLVIPWEKISAWIVGVLLLVLGLSYLIKTLRAFRPSWMPDAHRYAFIAILDRFSDIGHRRQYGETRERHAARLKGISPSFGQLTELHLAIALGARSQQDEKLHALCMQVKQELKNNLSIQQRLWGQLNPCGWWFTR